MALQAEVSCDTSLKCNTLVFFDLETTGLPAYHAVRVTELSFCSVERQQFLYSRSKEMPRVTNRLNLCIYPSRLVDPVASNKTKLDNYNLEHQGKFDEDVYCLILSFLNRLRRPICLIAHNGFKFDFPILKAEIAKLGKELPEDILCADSLDIFRKLQHTAPTISSFDAIATKENEESYSTQSSVNPFQFINEKTPEKKDSSDSDARNGQPRCKRRLTYRLEDVYERAYGEKPEVSHAAEADVQALLLSAIATSTQFLKFVDLDAVPFTKIRKCW